MVISVCLHILLTTSRHLGVDWVADIVNYLVHLYGADAPTPHSAHLNYQNAVGNTSLHWASFNGHLECVKALVAAGANIALPNDAGHDAVYEADTNFKEDVAEWLLTQRKEPELKSVIDENSPPCGAIAAPSEGNNLNDDLSQLTVNVPQPVADD